MKQKSLCAWHCVWRLNAPTRHLGSSVVGSLFLKQQRKGPDQCSSKISLSFCNGFYLCCVTENLFHTPCVRVAKLMSTLLVMWFCSYVLVEISF